MKKLTTISLFIFFVFVTAILTAGLVFYQNNKNANLGNNINTTVGNNSNKASTNNSNTISNNTNNSTSNNNSNSTTTTTTPATSSLTSANVAKHNTNTDCWIIVNNRVYDISGYASSHPGGTRNITNYCGKESTSAYDTKGGRGGGHSSNADQELSQFFVGNLK